MYCNVACCELRSQLLEWCQQPASPRSPITDPLRELEDHIGWLEEGFSRAKAATRELRSHKQLFQDEGLGDSMCSIDSQVLPLLLQLAEQVRSRYLAFIYLFYLFIFFIFYFYLFFIFIIFCFHLFFIFIYFYFYFFIFIYFLFDEGEMSPVEAHRPVPVLR